MAFNLNLKVAHGTGTAWPPTQSRSKPAAPSSRAQPEAGVRRTSKDMQDDSATEALSASIQELRKDVRQFRNESHKAKIEFLEKKMKKR